MADREFETDRFASSAEQATTIREWSTKYHSLLGALQKSCTEVRRFRTLEHDENIEPFKFIRNARHEFIYPPQHGTTVERDDSRQDDGQTVGYEVTKEDITTRYNLALVTGRVTIFYDDAHSAVQFRVVDDLPKQAIPVIEPALAEAFANTPTKA